MADAAGNLLFYSDGSQVFDASQNLMANGAGLQASLAIQAVSVKKPGSNTEYYLICGSTHTLPGQQGLYYSTIDLSLAAGLGSVTAKNVLLSDSSNKQLAATLHCNGKDIWLLSHKINSNQFTAFLITAGGIQHAPVVSAVGPTLTTNGPAQLKISPNGSRAALAIHSFGYGLFDFDNSTGIVSNYQGFGPFPSAQLCQGIEFSPDGTKLYGTQDGAPNLALQWDLCAGSTSAVAASQTTLSVNEFNQMRSHMQLTTTGKIYYIIYQPGKKCFGVIQHPNKAGLSCHLQDTGDCVLPIESGMGLPGYVSNFFRQKPAFTYTMQCQTAQFNAFGSEFGQCYQVAAAGYSNLAAYWDFGDPASGTENTSNLVNPSHRFTAPGTYPVRVILTSKCNVDTVTGSVTVQHAAPVFTVSGPAAICAGETHSLHANGNSGLLYVWSTGDTALTVPVSPSVTTVYTVTAYDTLTGCLAERNHIVTMKYCVGLAEQLKMPEVVVYPNPGTELFGVKSNVPVSWQVRDVLGRLVLYGTEQLTEFTLNLSGAAPGVYFLDVHTGPVSKTLRVLKSGE